MSFDATLTLKNRLAADVTYVRLDDDAKSSTYTRADQPVGEPMNLIIAKTMAPAGYAGNDKFLVKQTKVKVDPATGKMSVLTKTSTISVPRSFTNEEVLDMIAADTSFHVEANIIKLRRGEV